MTTPRTHRRPARALLAGTMLLAGTALTCLSTLAQAETDGVTPAEVRGLLDREAIRQVISDYGYSFDTRDWTLHRSLFVDEIEMDFSASIGEGLVTMTADAWVDGVRPFFERLDATQHVAVPLEVRIDGDEAYVVSMLHAQHYSTRARGEPVQRMIGRYENWLVRTPGGWKLRKIVQHIDWNEGNWHVFEVGAGRSHADREEADHTAGRAVVERPAHVTIVVADAERLARWYHQVLGMRVGPEFVVPERGLAARLVYAGDFAVMLMESEGSRALPEHRRTTFADLAERGTKRIAFAVEDLPALAARLSEQGVAFDVPPRWFEDGEVRFMWSIIRDPEGNLIELVQE